MAHFGKFFFHASIYYTAETKFCVFVCKSVCVHARAQTKRPTASKFDTEILERGVLGTLLSDFLKIDLVLL